MRTESTFGSRIVFHFFSSGNQMVQYPIEDTWLLHFELVTLADYRWFVYYYIIYENVHVVTLIIIIILFLSGAE